MECIFARASIPLLAHGFNDTHLIFLDTQIQSV